MMTVGDIVVDVLFMLMMIMMMIMNKKNNNKVGKKKKTWHIRRIQTPRRLQALIWALYFGISDAQGKSQQPAIVNTSMIFNNYSSSPNGL